MRPTMPRRPHPEPGSVPIHDIAPPPWAGPTHEVIVVPCDVPGCGADVPVPLNRVLLTKLGAPYALAVASRRDGDPLAAHHAVHHPEEDPL